MMMGRRLAVRLLFAAIAAAQFSACRGVGDLTGPTPVGASVVSVQLSSELLSLTEGNSVALQVTARDDKRQPLIDRKVVWSSSDTAVSRVSSVGLVSAIRPGTARIAVSVDGQSAVARVTVLARTVASVTVTPNTPTVLVGGFVRLTARTADGSGTALTDRAVFWSSSDPRIVVVDANGLLTGISVGGATVTATSEARSATVGVTVAPVPVATVRLLPPRDTVLVGQTTQFTATPLDSAGTPLSDLVTWTSGAGTVASVSSSGFVQGITPGTAVITATSGGRASTATVVVLSRPVGAVIVSPAQATLTVGQSVRLAVQITDANGNLLTGRPVSFNSSDATIASVAADGTVSTLEAGDVTITVTSEGKTATVAVTVLPSPIASLRISPSTAAVLTGGTVRLLVDALDASGGVLGQRVVTWRSGAPNVARVATDGLVTGLTAGTALVFAQSEGRIAAATITVSAITARTVTVTPASGTLIVGDNADLTATARDAANQLLSARPTTWSSSNNSIAVVSSSGRVRAIAPGTVRIDAVMDGVTGSSNFSVLSVPVATVTVSIIPSLIVGQSAFATVVLRDAAANVLTGRNLLWSSSSPSVAAINTATGEVTAVNPGTTNIIATSEGKSGQAVLAVTPIPVATVSLTLPVSSIFVGASTQATVVLRDASGAVLSGRVISFSSSNPSVATVDGSGVVTGVGPGTSSITASSEGRSASASIAVALVPVASVNVALGNSALFVGTTTQATATLRDASNNVLTGRPIAWTSSNPAVATVSGTGVVTAVGVGSANIIASSGGQSGQASLTATLAPVATVTVAPSTLTLVVGAASQLNATTRDALGNVLFGRVITWSSSDANVVSVSPTGQIGAVGPGSAVVTATSEGQTGQATITIIPPPVATVNVSLASSSVAEGGSTQATAVTLDGANNVLTGRVITWASSNTTVATVDNSGVVTALVAGVATITATSEGKSGSASITVVPPPVATVTVTIASPTVMVGTSTSATAVTRDGANNILSGRVISWSTSDPSIARVDAATGVITPIAPGVATITATSEGKTGSADVTVVP